MLVEAGLALGLAGTPLVRERLRSPVSTRRAGCDAGFASLNGGVTRYDWRGPKDAPVTVCIHGLTTPSEVWGALVPVMAAMGGRVLTYDLSGRGLSDRIPGDQDIDHFCDQLLALLDDQQVSDPVHLIGYSMGGAIATAFAARLPDRVRHLTLLAPAGMGHALGTVAEVSARLPVLGDWLFHMGFPLHHSRATKAAPPAPALPGLAETILSELGRRDFVGAVLSSLRGALSESREADHRALAASGLPITAIWGEEDNVIPLANRSVLRDWNPSIRHAVIYGAGHGLTYTHAEAVLAALPLRA